MLGLVVVVHSVHQPCCQALHGWNKRAWYALFVLVPNFLENPSKFENSCAIAVQLRHLNVYATLCLYQLSTVEFGVDHWLSYALQWLGTLSITLKPELVPFILAFGKGKEMFLCGRQILGELQPQANFSTCTLMLAFLRSKTANYLSMRRATNTCQKQAANKCSAIQQFHHSIQRAAKMGDQVRPLGRWTPRTNTNMDQIPLPFIFTVVSTCTNTGERSVWVHGEASGLEKHQ